MNRKISILFLLCILFNSFLTIAQVKPAKDTGVYKEKQSGYFRDVIMKSFNKDDQKDREAVSSTYFTVDFDEYSLPNDITQYTTFWHNPPLSQGITGTCWCFAGISFFESEINRLAGIHVKLSEMYIVYWEYVERARAFVKNKGDIYFAEGSEANAVIRIMKTYGAVPFDAYLGKPKNQEFHDHGKMVDEMNKFLAFVKENNFWNEKTIIETIQSILKSYMGEPPQKFTFQGKEFTPGQFLTDVLKLNLYDYYSFMSTMELPYNERGELVEPDNWWHSTDYYNVSLEDYFSIITNSVSKGYTVSICGDVSEPGNSSREKVSVIPSFDIPADFINASSRQLRLVNQSTTDDHCIHIVGYTMQDGAYWFLVKDSGSGAFDVPPQGYRFMHQDYIKLKMMNILVHKNAAKPVLDKIIK
jgi:bleomycin hydrolase